MEIYSKAGENVCIMGVREWLHQPFQATDWLDLRVGFMLSIESATVHDTITGLAEDIGADDTVPIAWTDRFHVGLYGSSGPGNFVFCGYINAGTGNASSSPGRSRLLSSDAAIGTTNTDYWRPTNGRGNQFTAQIIETSITRANGTFGSQPHFVQNYSGGHAAGYATLLMLRFTRPDAGGRARIITMELKKAATGDNSDILFTSTPTKAILESNLETIPANTQRLGPVELSFVPNWLSLYWPFHNSRLRIHCMGILKVA